MKPEAINVKNEDDVEYTQLYAKRKKIYPKYIVGKFSGLRRYAAVMLLGLYYGFPWIQWNGRQAVLFDLPERQFHYFGITFWPQDFLFLTVLLIIAALTLFFFTALAGRLWCGYACPQTVWTKTFLAIEKWVEGDRNERIKLDRQKSGLEKIRKKLVKHTAWLLFALFTGFTFVGYFTPILELGDRLIALSLGPWETFWVLFYSFATYGNAGWLREQVCIYMCPYARFQGAMLDKDSLIISYDVHRGEKRGARKKNMDYKSNGLGDCIDCNLCVNVCPTGIDIRNGLQVACIACAACIDACDSIMEKMNYPKGLVRYTTERSLAGGERKIVRWRVVSYFVLLSVLMVSFVYAIAVRVPVDLDIIRDRNRLYLINSDGLVENMYTLKVLNMDQVAHRYRIAVSGLDGVQIKGSTEIEVAAGEQASVPMRLAVDSENLSKLNHNVQFTVTNTENPEHKKVQNGQFIGPDYQRLLRN